MAACNTNWSDRCAERRAHWVRRDTILWKPVRPAHAYSLHWSAEGGLNPGGSGPVGGERVKLVPAAEGVDAALADRFPHLEGYLALNLPQHAIDRAGELLRGQLAVQAVDEDGRVVDATGLQIPGVLDDLYAYDGPLGVAFGGGAPVFRLWAPTARGVSVQVYVDADTPVPFDTLALANVPGTGVWRGQGPKAWSGKYFVYSVEVYVPSTGRIETNLVTDPYSVSLSADSKRSHIVDLGAPALKPDGWDALVKPTVRSPADIVIYELHVRDFSIADHSVPPAARGTFAAFRYPDAAGMRHLRALAAAGMTHVHLLPAFDFATVPERRADQSQARRLDLAALPPSSPQQQAQIEHIKETDGFNWGYDPWHYTVPEGSYATDPDGARRILEFRDMVRSLNQSGLNVVMDVVYNHTSQSGQSPKSVLDRIVPGYYQRLNAAGDVETSTCCANTATEHVMMEKLMIDSVLTWARAYKVDGFRFDLMGHHSKANMLRLRAALDRLSVESDGVDGRRIYLYGEGWNFGEVADNARFEQATQANMAGTGIGTFFDRLRDGVRGGTPFIDPREQGFVTGLAFDPNGWESGNGDQDLEELLRIKDWIRVGLAGGLADYRFQGAHGKMVTGADVDYLGDPAGYTASPVEQITYVAAHDNETLFDAVQMKASENAGMDARLRMQNLATSLVALGQGVPFFHAGQEILRSKSMDRDSFNSGDWFNEIDWSLEGSGWGRGLPPAEKNRDNWPLMAPLLANPALVPTPAHRQAARAHFLEMLAIRASSPLFRLGNAQAVNAGLQFHNTGPGQVPGLIVMSLTDSTGQVDVMREAILVVFNASAQAISVQPDLPPANPYRLHPVQSASWDNQVKNSAYDHASRTFRVPARTTAVFERLRVNRKRAGR